MLSKKVMLIRKKFINNLKYILTDIREKNKKLKISRYPTFVLGVSGGPDSIALLHLFYNISLYKNITLIVAHFNHMIRKDEAKRDENFVKETCKKLNIKVVAENLRNKPSQINEEVLRKARFDFFKKVAKRFRANFLALAHTKDDSLETVFMNLLKGKTLKPIIGIELWHKFTKSSFLIHPLLNISKQELLDFTINSNLSFVIDSSNLKDTFFRNYIRQKIFPTLKTFKNSFFRSLEIINNNWKSLNNGT